MGKAAGGDTFGKIRTLYKKITLRHKITLSTKKFQITEITVVYDVIIFLL